MQRSPNTDPILRLEAVKLTLMSLAGPVNILNGIELVIRQGEAVGLVGPSGSGKSTMLMVMTGLERPTSGKVTVKSQELSALSEDEAARFRRGNVGIVFQSFHLIPTMTALENVAVPLELALAPDAFARAKQELIDVGLGHRLDHYPSQLSGGEQQRVALARALAPRPSLLFADEPTGNLDGRTGAEIIEMLFKLQRERGSTLVLVTHDEALAKRCDRIVRLRDGAIESIEDAVRDEPEPVAPAPQPPVASVAPVVVAAPVVAAPPPPEPKAPETVVPELQQPESQPAEPTSAEPPPREPEPFQPFAPSVIEVPSIMEAPIPDEPIAAAGPVAPEVPATQTAAPLAAPEATPEPEAPIVSDPAPVVTAPQAASPEPPGPADKTAEPRPPGPASAPAVAE